MELLVFRVGDQRHALALEQVERVILAVEVMPLPGAPASVLGVIDLAGHALPVYAFGAGPRSAHELRPSHQMIIARLPHGPVALAVDEVEGVRVLEGGAQAVGLPASGPEPVATVAQLGDGLTLIHDLARFLSAPEQQALDAALEQFDGR